jgi:hypothetical protein
MSGHVRSWGVALDRRPGQHVPGTRNLLRRDTGLLRKRQHGRFVVRHVVEHAGEEARLARCRSDVRRANTGCSQKSAQPGFIGRKETSARIATFSASTLPFAL